MPNRCCSAVFVPSILANLQSLVEDLAGPGTAALLGLRWSFAHFTHQSQTSAEFDLPISWSEFASRLHRHAGIILEAKSSDSEAESYDRLAFRQPIIVAIDSFHLPYRPAFGRVHSARTLILQSLNEEAQTVGIVDPWLPSYSGDLALADLQRARTSEVVHDIVREPLFAGLHLTGQWWTVALAAPPSITTKSGLKNLLGELAQEAGNFNEEPAISRMEDFHDTVHAILTEPLEESRERRRAAALLLRAEIGLRAYLLELLIYASSTFEDGLLKAEIARWAVHLDDLGRARDVLIKSVVFDRPEYRSLVDASLVRALRREARFVALMSELFVVP